MHAPQSEDDHQAASRGGVSRRTVLHGAAWSVPMLAAAVSVPLAAASTTPDPGCGTFGPTGLYGASGSVIFRYSGDPATTGSGFTVQENSGAYLNSHWSSNLAFGLDRAAECSSYAFYGSRWSNAYLNIYKAVMQGDGTTLVSTIGPIPSGATWNAWGGLGVDPSGFLWMVSNLTALTATEIARVDPLSSGTLTSSFTKTSVGLTPAGPNAAAATGSIIPDITFTPDGRLWVMLYNASLQVWLAELGTDVVSGQPTTISPVVQVTGPSAAQSTYIYGFGWRGTGMTADSGYFHSSNGSGVLYRIDPVTGVSEQVGAKTSPATYDYALTDLASAPVPGDSATL